MVMSETKTIHEPADDIEKAIFDLQDVKNNYELERREFDAKNTTVTQFQKFENPANEIKRPQTQGNAGGRLKHLNGDIMHDPDAGLHGEMDKLSFQDLKERLIVAEKVMKSLF